MIKMVLQWHGWGTMFAKRGDNLLPTMYVQPLFSIYDKTTIAQQKLVWMPNITKYENFTNFKDVTLLETDPHFFHLICNISNEHNIKFLKNLLKIKLSSMGVSIQLSTIFQLYSGSQLYWCTCRKPEYPEKNNIDMSEDHTKLYLNTSRYKQE
jgi:hypothetical protein